MQRPNPAPHHSSKHFRTLLVEPDAQTRQDIQFELSVRGQAVVDCPDTAAAMALFHDNVFALVLIGSRLPDDDGLALCRDIRALPGGDETVIIVVSQAPSDNDLAAAIEAGADDCISWTADGDQLADQIETIMTAARERMLPDGAAGRGACERFLVINTNGTIREAAPVAERLLGFPPEAIVGVNAFSFFHPDDAPQLLSMITESFTGTGRTRAIEARVRRDGDSWQTVTISATNQTTDPRVQGVAFELRGPDANVGSDDQVTRAAMHDRLTDLPNRNLFIDRIDHAVVRASRSQQPIVVMVIDFADYVAADGQTQADDDDGLVIAVAQRLRSCLRSSDTAARLGHDQFGILLEEILAVDNIEIVSDRIIRAMSVPFYTGGTELTLTAHIGVAVNTPNRNRAVDLLRDANIARAWARVQGSGSHVLFDPSMLPPDDESTTSEFAVGVATPVAPAPGLDQRLDELNQRIASLEQTLARFAPVVE
ncbi:MAG TPA: diguanylate cyclase [Thermomicrobiales bacterium]|nr:diguanylate cyclase [Thermomicrobiales bacterium]